MKILHLMLSCFYVDGYNYQENELPRQNKLDGHDVRIIASTLIFDEYYNVYFCQPSYYINEDGIPVTRIPYSKWIIKKLKAKINKYDGLIPLVEEFCPDVILAHGIGFYDLIDIAKYKEKHHNIKLYVDNHAFYFNSARTWISKHILHRIYYKFIIQKTIPQIDKVLALSMECMDFLKSEYNIPESMIEFYPLGGTIYEGETYENLRVENRRSFKIDDDCIVVLASGKFNIIKKTLELLRAFVRTKNNRIQLYLCGSFSDDIKYEAEQLISKDERIHFMGWQNRENLIKWLCSADTYIQPGSQSATMQNALCCGCPMILAPESSHDIYMRNNGWYVSSEDDILKYLNLVSENPDILQGMREKSWEVAHDLLDYKKLAARLYK